MKPITKSGGRSKRSRLTVIVIRNFGRVRSFQFSSGWITLLMVMFFVLAGAVGYLVYENQNLRLESQRLRIKFKLPPETVADQMIGLAEKTGSIATAGSTTVETEAGGSEEVVRVKKTAKSNGETADPEAQPTTTAVTTQAESAAEAVIKPAPTVAVTLAEAAAGSPTETDPTATTTEPDPSATAVQTTAAPTAAATGSGPENIESPSVKVDDFEIVRLTKPQGWKVSYKLRNNLGNSQKISGYTLMAASLDSNPELVSPFPRAAIFEEAKPANYKQGVYFSIFQFKTIRGRIYTVNDINKLTVLVYGKDGELLVRKTYDVPTTTN